MNLNPRWRFALALFKNGVQECFQRTLVAKVLRSKVRIYEEDLFGSAKQECNTGCHFSCYPSNHRTLRRGRKRVVFADILLFQYIISAIWIGSRQNCIKRPTRVLGLCIGKPIALPVPLVLTLQYSIIKFLKTIFYSLS